MSQPNFSMEYFNKRIDAIFGEEAAKMTERDREVAAKTLKWTMGLDILSESSKQSEVEMVVNAIRKAVCDYSNLQWQDIVSPRRDRPYPQYRQIACYLLDSLQIVRRSEVGEYLGINKHRTTIISIVKNFNGWMQFNEEFRNRYRAIETETKRILGCVSEREEDKTIGGSSTNS